MKKHCNVLLLTGLLAGFFTSNISAEPSEHFKVFLCFGQSNIAGGAGVSPTSDVTSTTDRVIALAFNNCSSPSWQKDTWVSAREPLHCGDGGAGNSTMGPVYVFGKAMADSLPDDTIGLIPCGQSGVNIETFMPGDSCNAGYCVPYPGSNVYDWMLKKCQKAVERGVLAGIVLHQGESNTGDDDWTTKVKTIYDDLKRDIPLSNDIPLVAGELLQSKQEHIDQNKIIDGIPTVLPIGYVAKSDGLSGGGTYADLHFNQDGYHQMGKRFAVEMMKGLRASGAITSVTPRPSQKSSLTIKNLQGSSVTTLYTIDGKKLPASSLQNKVSNKKHCIYVMQQAGSKASLVINPD